MTFQPVHLGAMSTLPSLLLSKPAHVQHDIQLGQAGNQHLLHPATVQAGLKDLIMMQ